MMVLTVGRVEGTWNPTFSLLPVHTYHNHWEERLSVMEGPQSHSKEHQMGEQECKWQPVYNKSTRNKVNNYNSSYLRQQHLA